MSAAERELVPISARGVGSFMLHARESPSQCTHAHTCPRIRQWRGGRSRRVKTRTGEKKKEKSRVILRNKYSWASRIFSGGTINRSPSSSQKEMSQSPLAGRACSLPPSRYAENIGPILGCTCRKVINSAQRPGYGPVERINYPLNSFPRSLAVSLALSLSHSLPLLIKYYVNREVQTTQAQLESRKHVRAIYAR